MSGHGHVAPHSGYSCRTGWPSRSDATSSRGANSMTGSLPTRRRTSSSGAVTACASSRATYSLAAGRLALAATDIVITSSRLRRVPKRSSSGPPAAIEMSFLAGHLFHCRRPRRYGLRSIRSCQMGTTGSTSGAGVRASCQMSLPETTGHKVSEPYRSLGSRVPIRHKVTERRRRAHAGQPSSLSSGRAAPSRHRATAPGVPGRAPTGART